MVLSPVLLIMTITSRTWSTLVWDDVGEWCRFSCVPCSLKYGFGGGDNIDNIGKGNRKVAYLVSAFINSIDSNLSKNISLNGLIYVLAEVYLIYAEAILHAKGDLQKAIDKDDIVYKTTGV